MNSHSEPGGNSRAQDGRGRKFEYRGHEVEIYDADPGSIPTVRVGATEIVIRREEGGGFSAPMLNMFQVYESLGGLARGLIDSSPVFLSQRRVHNTDEDGGGDASSS